MPAWDPRPYRRPGHGVPLTTWEEALDRARRRPGRRPAVVMRFGSQVDIKGIIAPSADADRAIRYLTKYLTKAVAETYTDAERPGPRLRGRTSTGSTTRSVCLPCSPECGNWLRYGIQPKNAGPGLAPGWCARRPTTGRTSASAAAASRSRGVVRQDAERAQGRPRRPWCASARRGRHRAPDADRLAADVLADDGLPRYAWEDGAPWEADYATDDAWSRSLQAQRWRRRVRDRKPQLAGRTRASPDAREARGLWTAVRQPLPRGPPDSQPIPGRRLAVQGERSESRSDTKCP